MSVEGMWLLRTSQHDSSIEEIIAPSILIFETGRIFGGDSVYYFIGDYDSNLQEIFGRVRVRTHTPTDSDENVFGMVGPVDFFTKFSGRIEHEIVTGRLEPEGDSASMQHFRMTKLSELP
jgi:hypothetical protein